MIINQLPIIMIVCLSVTIIVELMVAIILKIRNRKDLINIILVNCFTNPLVVAIPVYVNIMYGIKERHITLLVLEVLTVLIEGIVYKKFLKYKAINPILLSLMLNASSYVIGEIINQM